MLDLDAEAIYRAWAARLREHLIGRQPQLVGIHTGGVWLAERLMADLKLPGPIGILDVSFYRDDHSRGGFNRDVRPSAIPFAIADADLLLVDDVLNTGRTVRAAMNELFDYGRPERIELAVLIDRGGRELPISTPLVGRTIELPSNVSVVLSRDDDQRLHLRLEDQTKD
jgi:pyrimidine operon attenuation protein/uracil phosphoribosyltransferase